jgi:glycosyltransferase involved in cell wall biosynthesis
MLRVPVTAARLVAVHSAWLAEDLREAFREARVETIRMGVADPLGARPPHAVAQERARLRARYGIPESAVLFVAFGRVTPEKRIGPAMRALAALAGRGIDVRLLLAGDVADHYALDRDLARSGARQRVAIAGHVPDEEVPAVLAAADVCLALRWPTARETSASWLRAVAAGKPTVVTDLAHTVDVPALDPRDWSVQPAARPQVGPAELSSAVVPAGGDADGGDRPPLDRPDAWPSDEPVAVAIDILDEDHSLALALERLATDADLRARLGASARRYFERGHTIAHMVADYRRVIARARDDGRWPEAAALAKLPRHLLADGAARARAILAEVGVAVDLLDW